VVGFVLFSAITLGIGIWINRLQDDYLREYAAAAGSRSFVSANLLALATRPWQLFRAAPLTNIFRATGTRQADARLEALRQRYLERRRLGYAAIFVSWLAWVLIGFR